MPRTIADPIDYLVDRKYPQARALAIPPSLSNFGAGSNLPGDERERLERQVAAYRDELRTRTAQEIAELVQAEKAKEATFWRARIEREESERFFNQPRARADFVYWSKATYWKLDEALALAFGKAPESVTWDSVKPHVSVSAFAREYSRIRELAIRAKNFKQLSDPVLPGVFLAWARRTQIAVPDELIQEVQAHGVTVGDWQDLYEKLKADFDGLLGDHNKIAGVCKMLMDERDVLTQQLASQKEEAVSWQFDVDDPTYPVELDIAMQAWRAVTNQREPSLTPKQQLTKWLKNHYPHLRAEQCERMSMVCNWEKQGGRPPSGTKGKGTL